MFIEREEWTLSFMFLLQFKQAYSYVMNLLTAAC